MSHTHILKCIVVGNSRVGKSSIVEYYTRNSFPAIHDTTIGVEFGTRTLSLKENTIVKLQIWDTAGQESFRAITRSYYRDASIIFIVFDLNDVTSYDNIDVWVEDALRYCEKEHKLIYFIGNKTDLIRKCPSFEDIINKLNKLSLVSKSGKKHSYKYYEISAKNREQIVRIFNEALNELFEKYPECQDELIVQPSINFSRRGNYLLLEERKKSCRC